jgi:hypothetical protein
MGKFGFQISHDLNPGSIGHRKIQQHNIGLEILKPRDGLSRILDTEHIGEPGFHQQSLQKEDVLFFVIDDKNF